MHVLTSLETVAVSLMNKIEVYHPLSLIVDVNKWLQQAAHTGPEYVPGEHRPQEKITSQPDLMDLNSSMYINIYNNVYSSILLLLIHLFFYVSIRSTNTES